MGEVKLTVFGNIGNAAGTGMRTATSARVSPLASGELFGAIVGPLALLTLAGAGAIFIEASGRPNPIASVLLPESVEQDLLRSSIRKHRRTRADYIRNDKGSPVFSSEGKISRVENDLKRLESRLVKIDDSYEPRFSL